MFDGLINVLLPLTSCNVKKLPLFKSREAVLLEILKALTFPTTLPVKIVEPDAIKLPVIAVGPVILGKVEVPVTVKLPVSTVEPDTIKLPDTIRFSTTSPEPEITYIVLLSGVIALYAV